MQKFLSEFPIASLDDKTLYVIRDCIEWKNEALTKGVSEIKETQSGLKLVNEVILEDLKWFYKQCAGEDKDYVALIEDIIREIQNKFLEIQEKKVPTREDFSNISHVEAILIINKKHLEMHEAKITELKREKEVLKRRISYISLPH